MSENDGGPVHPIQGQMHSGCIKGECCRVSEGLSLRDYFAAQAMPHMPDFWRAAMPPARDEHIADSKLEELAHGAYRIADAMLKAREVKP